jgi:hypothetical protein
VTNEELDKAAVDDLVGALLEPDWHDPACPFKDHCHCGSDDEPPPHDRVSSDLQVRAANRIKALEEDARYMPELLASLEAALQPTYTPWVRVARALVAKVRSQHAARNPLKEANQ